MGGCQFFVAKQEGLTLQIYILSRYFHLPGQFRLCLIFPPETNHQAVTGKIGGYCRHKAENGTPQKE